MKTETASYIEKDEKETRLPVELYHIWNESGTHWRYTSGDTTITYDGETFIPATIKRQAIEYNEGIESAKVNVIFNYVAQPAIQYIATNPVDITWIQVIKFFRDQSPYSGSTLFMGTIKNVSFNGPEATAECTGFEQFFRRQIPRFRYQPSCNYFLYDDNCTVNSDNYKLGATIATVDSTGLILTGTNFGTKDDDYFTWGYLEYSTQKRMIIYHTGETIKIRYPITDLAAGSAVIVYAGCNKKVETCKDKFDNKINFGGHPFIPIDNPVFWS